MQQLIVDGAVRISWFLVFPPTSSSLSPCRLGEKLTLSSSEMCHRWLKNSLCHNQNGQISSAPSSSVEAVDKSTNAEKSEKDCSADNKARENTKTRKLLDIFKFGGEAKHVGCNPHLKWICEDDAYCFHPHFVGWWGKVFCGITSPVCLSFRCSFKSLGIEKCAGKPVRRGSLSI